MATYNDRSGNEGTKRNIAARKQNDPECEELAEMQKSDSFVIYDEESLPKLLEKMEEFARRHHVDIIKEEGRKVLISLIDEKKPHQVLELGTAIGYSSLLIAIHAAKDVEITSMELIEKRVMEARFFHAHSPYKDRIKVIPGSAGDSLVELPKDKKYDLVYIDAAKAQYPDYFRKVYPILSDDAWVIADNVLFHGLVYSNERVPRRMRTITKRLREYIDIVSNHREFETVIRHDGDGLAVSKRINK